MTTRPHDPENFREQSFDAKWLEQKLQQMSLHSLAKWLIIIGLVIGIGGHLSLYYDNLSFRNLVADLYANLSSELLSIVFTILVLDRLNENRAIRQRKDELIRQMRSSVKEEAIRAIEEFQDQGWLYDGSLQKAKLVNANFSNINLYSVDLRYALLNGANLTSTNLHGATLQFAELTDADLASANLWRANLQSSDLRLANLHSANMWDADLKGADLSFANLTHAQQLNQSMWHNEPLFDEQTTLPDGTKWTKDTDLARFTNPDHPHYWQPTPHEGDPGIFNHWQKMGWLIDKDD